MSNAPFLNTSVLIGAAIVFAIVFGYMFFYTRRLRTPRGVGKTEGIAAATERKERTGRTGTIDRAA